MIVRRTSAIRSWPAWDHEVNKAAEAFHAEFDLWPIVLLASSPTFARIDMIADKARYRDAEGAQPAADEYAALGSFSGEAYSLAFCIDERVSTGFFVLVFDDDPEGGEPVPVDDTPAVDALLRRRA